MKTRILLTTLGVAALTAITFNTNGALLSPRAMGNQIKIVSGTANDPDLVAVDQGLALPPRALGNQIATTAGTNGNVNPALACVKTMNGTPKAIQACVQQANMPGCNTVAVAPLK
ncbi:MAG TPA: hypothetical protein VJT54_07965 [Verrucomicrobiae bacterium]|nr:hypothetical protein [Verrucomicrobiae bacterium]